MLKGKIGKDVMPYLKRSAISNALMAQAKDLGLNLVVSEEPNISKNCHHIEIEGKECVITLNHTDRKKALPRKAKFRDNHMYDSQMRFDTLFDNVQLLHQDKTYIMVTHGGYDQLDFINIGLPNSEGRSWEASYLIDLGHSDYIADTNEILVDEEMLVSLLAEENIID